MSRLGFFIAAVFLLVGIAPAQQPIVPAQQPEVIDPPQAIETPQYRPTRELYGDDLRQAREIRDKADLMQADFQKKRTAQKSAMSGEDRRGLARRRREALGESRLQGTSLPLEPIALPLTPELEEEAEKIIDAYQEVIDRYPHTEIAAYCAMRLSGVYRTALQPELAGEILERTAVEFAGTPEGMHLLISTGSYYMQMRNDHATAIKWYELVPKPSPSNESHELGSHADARRVYVTAQRNIIKCEMRLGMHDQAERRLASLKQAFPSRAAGLDDFHARESRAQATLPQPLRPNPRAKYVILGNLLILGFFILMAIRRLRASPSSDQGD